MRSAAWQLDEPDSRAVWRQWAATVVATTVQVARHAERVCEKAALPHRAFLLAPRELLLVQISDLCCPSAPGNAVIAPVSPFLDGLN